MKNIINNKTLATSLGVAYTVYQSKDSTTYSGILADTIELPKQSFVTLVASNESKQIRYTGDSKLWSTSSPLVPGAPVDPLTQTEASVLYATKPTQAASTATDVAGLLADFNTLLAKLKTVPA